MLDQIMLIIGISGVLVIALNFILEATNRLGKDHKSFALLNVYGSSALFIYSLYEKVWLFVVLNGFLIFVGFYGIYQVFRNKKK
ncbi:MAG: hypothetical protein PF569_07525 [Candidatus Woesearchaeota archaeon]|jgi:hypothetical protein|nr:hypothetical protein [Candidatus Woesearchaeota archaeon]